MKNSIRKFREEDFISSTWSGGTTQQLFIYPENSTYEKRNFKARISCATVEMDGSNFTKLKGFQRFITPLDGQLRLAHDGDSFINLSPFDVYEFGGNCETKSQGKVTDFNLMLADGIKGKLKSFYIEGGKEIALPALSGINILYSYNADFFISIHGEESTLLPHELMVIKSSIIYKIKIKSTNGATILLSHFLDNEP